MAEETNLNLRDILDRSLLYRMAGPRLFNRGVDYFERGLVRSLTEHNGVVAAKVIGEEEYAVRLWREKSSLSASCTCPIYASGNFCKHCVATGLAYIEAQIGAEAECELAVVKLDDVRAYLRSVDKDMLIEMILEQLLSDDRLRERLLLKAARTRGKDPDLAGYRQAIEDAVYAYDFVDYRSMPDYASEIEAVVDSVRDLLQEGYAKEAIELSEYFLSAVERQLAMVDDSDGHMGGILHSIEDLYHEACGQAKPDLEQLALRLLQWELQSKTDVFYGSAERYADVLGDRGLAAYQQLAQAEWDKAPPLAPGQDSSERYGVRYRITSIMEILARHSGDIEALVQVKSRDLSHPYSFLQIAGLYQETGQMDEAIQWAERGLKEFPDRPDGRLRVFLAKAYHSKGRYDEEMALIWAEFADSPRLDKYQQIKSHADGVGQWLFWRTKALDFLRTKLRQEDRNDRDHSWMVIRADHSELVRILLWEEEVEDAWREAQGGGCSDNLWLELARRREEDHPLESLQVYKAQVDPIVGRKTYDAYEQAVEIIRAIGGILTRLGREREFAAYIEGIRGAHRRKRNFMQLLERAQ